MDGLVGHKLVTNLGVLCPELCQLIGCSNADMAAFALQCGGPTLPLPQPLPPPPPDLCPVTSPEASLLLLHFPHD